MDQISDLRRRADNCFRFSKNTTDARLKAQALALGEQYLAEADALAAKTAGMACTDFARMSVTRRTALSEVARVDADIRELDAEPAGEGRGRGNDRTALCDERSRLLKECGLKPANDRGGAQPR
jgi:hypothetical protein